MSQCDAGSVQCCNSISAAGAPSNAELFGTLSGLFDVNENTPLGLTCNPIDTTGVGSGGNWCVFLSEMGFLLTNIWLFQQCKHADLLR